MFSKIGCNFPRGFKFQVNVLLFEILSGLYTLLVLQTLQSFIVFHPGMNPLPSVHALVKYLISLDTICVGECSKPICAYQLQV